MAAKKKSKTETKAIDQHDIEEAEKARKDEMNDLHADQFVAQLDDADLYKYLSVVNKLKWWKSQIQYHEQQIETLRLRHQMQMDNLQRMVSGLKTAARELENVKLREVVSEIESKYGIQVDHNTVIDEETGEVTRINSKGTPRKND